MNLDILYELLSSWNFKEENVNRNADDDEKDMDEARYFTIQASLLHAINEAQDAVRAERQYDVKMERDMASGLAEQIILLSVSCDQYILYLDSIAQSSKNGSKALLAGQKKEMILEAKRELLDDDKVPLTEKIEKFYEVLNKHRSLLNTENDHLEMTFLKKIVVRFAALVGLMPGTFVYRSLLGATVNEEFMKSVDIKDAITSIKKEEQTGCEQSDLSSGQKNPH